jgi:hypothetical protein
VIFSLKPSMLSSDVEAESEAEAEAEALEAVDL